MPTAMPNRNVITHTRALERALRASLAGADDFAAAITWLGDSPKKLNPRGAAEWTNVLINTVLTLGHSQGFEVWPRRYYLGPTSKGLRNRRYGGLPDDRSEWLFDATWTRYPDLPTWVEHLRDPQRTGPVAGVQLACESEWGGKSTPSALVPAVLDDFAKLVECRAKLKLLFFSYLRPRAGGDAAGTFEDVVGLCQTLAETDDSEAGYLLMGWPFDLSWAARLDPDALRVAHLPREGRHGRMRAKV